MVRRSGCAGGSSRNGRNRAAGRRQYSYVKSIGEGAAELRINRGPGYRVYFGWDGKTLVILLGGGTKRRQQNDIEAALRRWRDYKKRKRSEG
jgi:putative addiction module killer protein